MKLYLRSRLCIPILGYNRGIIYDLNRFDYYFIPTEIHEIIETDDVIHSQLLDENWKEFLVEKEIIFEIENADEREMFPSVSKKYEVPNKLTSIIMHDNVTNENLDCFRTLHILNIAVIVEKFNLQKTAELLRKIMELEVDSVYLYLTEPNRVFHRNNFSPMNGISQLHNVYLLNDSVLADKNNEKYSPINVISLPYSLEMYASASFPEKMQINYNHFFESYNYHNYYNQKVYIDKFGNMKNGINCEQIFGNINEMTERDFLEIIDSEEFQKFWTINKKKTLVCQDCEFRYICTDCRAYTEKTSTNNERLDVSKPLKCGYNPYTVEWEEWSTNPLKQKTIDFYGLREIL